MLTQTLGLAIFLHFLGPDLVSAVLATKQFVDVDNKRIDSSYHSPATVVTNGLDFVKLLSVSLYDDTFPLAFWLPVIPQRFIDATKSKSCIYDSNCRLIKEDLDIRMEWFKQVSIYATSTIRLWDSLGPTRFSNYKEHIRYLFTTLNTTELNAQARKHFSSEHWVNLSEVVPLQFSDSVFFPWP